MLRGTISYAMSTCIKTQYSIFCYLFGLERETPANVFSNSSTILLYSKNKVQSNCENSALYKYPYGEKTVYHGKLQTILSATTLN